MRTSISPQGRKRRNSLQMPGCLLIRLKAILNSDITHSDPSRPILLRIGRFLFFSQNEPCLSHAPSRNALFCCSEAAKLCPENLVLIFVCPDLFQGLFQPLQTALRSGKQVSEKVYFFSLTFQRNRVIISAQPRR